MKRRKFKNCCSIEQVVGLINESENKAKLAADYANGNYRAAIAAVEEYLQELEDK